jgi:hypothetical protein
MGADRLAVKDGREVERPPIRGMTILDTVMIISVTLAIPSVTRVTIGAMAAA